MILPILLLLLAGCATAPGEADYWTQCVTPNSRTLTLEYRYSKDELQRWLELVKESQP